MKISRRPTSRTHARSRQELLHHDACEAVHLSGDANASYERHLVFDHVVASAAGQPARVLRGGGALLARAARAALAADGHDLCAGQPEAGLCPVDGVPDRALTDQLIFERMLGDANYGVL
jgi:hypothetical protein